MNMSNQRIEFHYHAQLKTADRAVEKELGGAKRRYLEGVSSGLKLDGHDERMTEKCIKRFQEQAKSGDVLLYAGKHGVNFFDDIGILIDSWVDSVGNWHTLYRLYDEQDGVGATTLEIVDKIWKQVNGLPPYSTPKQKGFSIEGDIPKNGIVSAVQAADGTVGNRVIDDVILDGVVLVNRPAYEDSIATAIYKALGESHPLAVKRHLTKSLTDKMQQDESREQYYRNYYKLQSAMEDEVRAIMKLDPAGRRPSLETLFSEYKNLMIQMLESNPDLYAESPSPEMIKVYRSADEAQYSVLNALQAELTKLAQLVKKPIEGAQ